MPTPSPRPVSPPSTPDEDTLSDWVDPIPLSGWRSVTIGFPVALVLYLWDWTRVVLYALSVIVHELGHALFAWLAGRGSIPRFDFEYGGGVAPTTTQLWFFLPIYVAFWGYLGWRLRHNRKARIVLPILVILQAVYAFTAVHEVVFLFMGHGFELVIAGVFLYRGLTADAVRHPAEQPLYAALGWFMWMVSLVFAWQLMFDEAFLRFYRVGKGGFLMNDFVRIGDDWLGWRVETVAGVLFGLSILLLPAVWLAARHRTRLRDSLHALLDTD